MPTSTQVKSETIELSDLTAHAAVDLFAVLDSCDEPLVLPKVDELGPRSSCLYSGDASVNYRAVAPYLVEVDEELLSWIESELSGRPWGVFLVSPAPLMELRKHLKRFLLVKLPDDRTVYFRFYDPRVIPTFLHSCDTAEATNFLGPIESFVFQDEDTLEYRTLALSG